MGQFFSDAVEQALQCIYYEMGSGRGQEGVQLLVEASNSGDGDASLLFVPLSFRSQLCLERSRFSRG